MAIFTPGIGFGQISGAVGGSVFSHNRGGPYVRRRAVPVTSTTSYAIAAKSRVTSLATRWKGLTDAEREDWTMWARQNPSFNRLGMSITLLGLNAYIKLNSRLLVAEQAVVDTPPVTPAPEGLLTMSLTADIGAGGTEVAYTPTPLGAGEMLWVEGALVDSAGINYVKPYRRFLGVSAAAGVSPYDYQSALEARLGAMVVGQTVHLFAAVFDSKSGQLSGFQRARATVVTT